MQVAMELKKSDACLGVSDSQLIFRDERNTVLADAGIPLLQKKVKVGSYHTFKRQSTELLMRFGRLNSRDQKR
jgi:hypothetical protein